LYPKIFLSGQREILLSLAGITIAKIIRNGKQCFVASSVYAGLRCVLAESNFYAKKFGKTHCVIAQDVLYYSQRKSLLLLIHLF